MDINQLRVFVTVVREGSITRASEVLCRSQPVISAHIKAMEDRLGIKLFERDSRGMSVTRSGLRLLTIAEELLEQHQRFREEASRVRGSLTGDLNVGVAVCAGNDTLRSVWSALAELYARFPDLRVRINRAPSSVILNGVRNGYLDAGFYIDHDKERSDLVTVEVARFNVYLAGAPQYGGAFRDCDFAALQEVPCICPPARTRYARMVEGFFKEMNFQPRRVIHSEDEAVTRQLIADGFGIGVIHGSTPPGGGIKVLVEMCKSVPILLGHLPRRADDPFIREIRAVLNATDDIAGQIAPFPGHAPFTEARAGL